ncbi:hypothetical protein SGLAM104S_09378 [Streptomyces glaucescens]
MTAAVAAAPDANPEATDIVKWHGLLTESQAALQRAEDDLLAALEAQPSEVDDPTMSLAHRVNAAVTAGRCLAKSSRAVTPWKVGRFSSAPSYSALALRW